MHELETGLFDGRELNFNKSFLKYGNLSFLNVKKKERRRVIRD